MFVFTAKLDKKKAVAGLILLGLILCALILFFGNRSAAQTSASSATVKNNQQRIEYLNSFGWQVESEPVDEETIVIPRKLTDVYGKYNDIQKAQGFDLSEYGGMEAVRYTYRVTNYPGCDDVVADMIVFRNSVIASDVQSVSLDGFMLGFEKPQSVTTPEAADTISDTNSNV